MYAEQVTTRRASNVSHHSTEWIVRLTGPGSQPWCRPASVACRVATSGTPRWCSSVVAACATSQSCACTTSNERSAQTASPARVSAWLSAIVQASRSSAKLSRVGSSATRTTRTPPATSS